MGGGAKKAGGSLSKGYKKAGGAFGGSSSKKLGALGGMVYGPAGAIGGKAYGRMKDAGWFGKYDPKGSDSGSSKSKSYSVPARAKIPKYTSNMDFAKAEARTKLNSKIMENARNNINSQQVDMRGMDALRNQALTASADSPWLKTQMERFDLQKQSDIDEMNAASMGREAQARAALSSKGGLSGGAAERLAAGSSLNNMLDRQRIQKDINTGRLGAQTSAEEQRLESLRQLPDQEMALNQQNLAKQQYLADLERGIAEGNISRAQAEAAAKRDFDMGIYSEQMKDWAAAKQANATQNAGERRGWFNQLFG